MTSAPRYPKGAKSLDDLGLPMVQMSLEEVQRDFGSATPLQNLTAFVEGVESAIALASNNEDAALAAIAEVDHQLVAYLKYCADAAHGSGSTFNEGVVRGLEIAAAQVEHGHYQHWSFAAPAEKSA